MKTQTTMASDLDTWQEERKLDEACCRLVANKVILARLLQEVIQEYHDCSVAELEQKYLEGEPSILSSSVDQDVPDPGRIKGETTVDKSQTEGTIMYDILFSTYSPRRKQDSQVIINVESQNQWDPGYSLMKRAAYYAARMLSRQKGTVFTGSDYGKLQKVYTIWICLELPKKKQNTITVFSMEPEHLVGNAEYWIPMTMAMEKEAENMCNIGRGIAVKYEEKGLEKGRKEGLYSVVKRMLKRGRSVQDIVDDTGVSEAEVRKLAGKQ